MPPETARFTVEKCTARPAQGALCRNTGAVRGVDGQPYCRRHAQILERRLDEWGEKVATLESVLGVPSGLPESMHAEWRQHRRNYMYAEANDVDLADQLFAILRLHQMRRDCA